MFDRLLLCVCAAFACLADSDNIDAGTRFARFCSGGALQPRPDGSTDLGFTVTCPANCAAALNNVRTPWHSSAHPLRIWHRGYQSTAVTTPHPLHCKSVGSGQGLQ